VEEFAGKKCEQRCITHENNVLPSTAA